MKWIVPVSNLLARATVLDNRTFDALFLLIMTMELMAHSTCTSKLATANWHAKPEDQERCFHTVPHKQ